MTTIHKLISAWMLTLLGSLLLPLVSFAAVSGTTYDTASTTMAAPATVAEHAVAIATGRSAESPLWSMASGHARSFFGLSRILDAPKTRVGYHATYPEAAQGIRQTGFRPGTKPGRLGSGGTYVSSSRKGAIAEFTHHNPGVKPEVLRVRYKPGVEAVTDIAPQHYVDELPLNVDSISAPSVRLPSAQNTITYNPVEVLP